MPLPSTPPQNLNPLLKFLVKLSKDAALYASFQNNPAQTMQKEGLSAEEQQLLQIRR